MNIVHGRGKNRRTVIELPCAYIVKQAPKDTQAAVKAFVCEALNIPVAA